MSLAGANFAHNPDSATPVVKSAQNNVPRQDWANNIRLANSHASLKHIAS